jgi:hypothetical protein
VITAIKGTCFLLVKLHGDSLQLSFMQKIDKDFNKEKKDPAS